MIGNSGRAPTAKIRALGVQNKRRLDADPIALVPMINSTKVMVASSAWVDVNGRTQQNLDVRPGRGRPTFQRSSNALAL
jgi:hypothetical protein